MINREMYMRVISFDTKEQIPLSEITYFESDFRHIVLKSGVRVSVIVQYINRHYSQLEPRYHQQIIDVCEFVSDESIHAVQIILPDNRYVISDEDCYHIQVCCAEQGIVEFRIPAATETLADIVVFTDDDANTMMGVEFIKILTTFYSLEHENPSSDFTVHVLGQYIEHLQEVLYV